MGAAFKKGKKQMEILLALGIVFLLVLHFVLSSRHT